jgi:predicted dehydrogenase
LVKNVEIVALVDKNLARARLLGERRGISALLDDYRQLPSDLDGVIIALPHHLHAPVASEFLQRGVAVLVDKPLALTTSEAERVIDIARAHHTLLQVSQMYRFCHRAQMVKRAIEQGWLGSVKSFSLEGNFADTNPMATGFAWNRKQAGGGTLVDVGSLILDLLTWWFGEPQRVEYADDSLGGVECDCELTMELRNPRGTISGNVILSRLRKLRDIVRIDGDRMSIVYGFETNHGLLELIPNDPNWQVPFLLDARSVPYQSHIDFFAEQLKNFAAAIRAPEKSQAPAESILPSLRLIEQCYRDRRPLEYPWESHAAAIAEVA